MAPWRYGRFVNIFPCWNFHLRSGCVRSMKKLDTLSLVEAERLIRSHSSSSWDFRNWICHRKIFDKFSVRALVFELLAGGEATLSGSSNFCSSETWESNWTEFLPGIIPIALHPTKFWGLYVTLERWSKVASELIPQKVSQFRKISKIDVTTKLAQVWGRGLPRKR